MYRNESWVITVWELGAHILFLHLRAGTNLALNQVLNGVEKYSSHQSSSKWSICTPESALEICNRNIKIGQCGGGGERSGCGTSKRSKLQKSSKNGTYITRSQRPHHTSVCSFSGCSGQETKGENANPDSLPDWHGTTAHSQFINDTKYYYKSSIW